MIWETGTLGGPGAEPEIKDLDNKKAFQLLCSHTG